MFLAIILMGVLGASFNVHKVEAQYPIIYIKADGSIDPATANITSSDNVTYIFTADINARIVVEKDNIVVDGAGYAVQGPGSSYIGISLDGRNNVTIKNVEVTNFTAGIYLSSSTNNNITGNTVSSNNEDGIVLSYSSNNTVTGNTASNGYEGIRLTESSYNNITGNVASNNAWGIHLEDSSNNSISGNNITGNSDDGIYLHFSSNNTVTGNTASNNNDNGIWLYFSSTHNVLIGNTISNNSRGIYLAWGSDYNVLFHNNLVSNTVQVSVTTVNTWDYGYPSGGNYWSNYTGVDLNHDGIGDTEHFIDANNTDNYPLMGMFHSFNTTLGKYVNVISNSTIEGFQYFESNSTIRMHVSNMTANQTHGFCRISIPYEVMSEPFNVTIDGANPTYWNYTLYDNGTHRWIYFEYEHTTLEIVIIPEFPSFLILPLFMVATLLAVMVYRKQLKKGNISASRRNFARALVSTITICNYRP